MNSMPPLSPNHESKWRPFSYEAIYREAIFGYSSATVTDTLKMPLQLNGPSTPGTGAKCRVVICRRFVKKSANITHLGLRTFPTETTKSFGKSRKNLVVRL